MAEENNKQIEEFMIDVVKLDQRSFEQLRFAAAILLAREQQVSMKNEMEPIPK